VPNLTKHLKNTNFGFNPLAKELNLFKVHNAGTKHEGPMGAICLTKTEIFSLMRFLIRIAQYEGRKHRK